MHCFQIYRKKDGEAIKAMGKYSETVIRNVYTLIINNIEQTDAGQYSVELNNTAGMATSTASLIVEGIHVKGLPSKQDNYCLLSVILLLKEA